jgi:hypothetical protein
VGRDLGRSHRLIKPLHLDQIDLAIKLDHAVDLLDDPLAFVADEMEGLADAGPVEGEQAVRHALKLFGLSVRILLTEERERGVAPRVRDRAPASFA